MNIYQLLDISDPHELKGAFEARAQPLIARMRNGSSPDTAADNELATLAMALFEHNVDRHYVTIPPGHDADDLIQLATLKAVRVAGDPEITLGPPFNYFQTILQNVARDLFRGRKHTVNASALDNPDNEIKDIFATRFEDGRIEHRPVLEDELREEHGSSLDELIRNNGFTATERVFVEDAISRLGKMPAWQEMGPALDDYYFGDLLRGGFQHRWQESLGMAEGTFKRAMFDLRKDLHRVLAHSYPGAYDHGIDEKMRRIENFRRTSRYKEPEPTAEHGFIPPIDMIHRMHKGYSHDLHAHMHEVLMDMLSTRQDELIALDDGTTRPAHEVFVRRNCSPHHGGRLTIYMDEQAQGFMQKEMHINPRHEGWLPLSRFCNHIGRHASEELRKETFNFLFKLWKSNRKVEVNGKKRPVREYLDFCTPPHAHQAEFMTHLKLPKEVEGMAMYASPELKPFMRQHLPCSPEGEERNWLRISGGVDSILHRTHLTSRGRDKKMGVAAYLAALMTIEDLSRMETIEYGDPPVHKKPKEVMRVFLKDGKHSSLEPHGVWLVDKDLIGDGKPINHDQLLALRTEILAHPENYPRFQAAHAALTQRSCEA